MKRFISLLLVALMLLPMVASCGTDETNAEESAEIITTKEEQTSEPIVYNTFDLSNFTVVFNNDQDLKVANDFITKVKQRTDVEMTSRRATSGKASLEFLFGNTGRDLSNEYFSKEIRDVVKQYGYVIDGEKIFFLGHDAYTMEKSMTQFLRDYVKKDGTIILEEKKEEIIDLDLEKEKIPVKENVNDLRLVSHNIIKMSLKYAAHSYRVGQLQILYALLDPDVIAVQECDELWFSGYYLDRELEKVGYKLAPIDPRGNNRIFYKEATVKLIDSGYVEYADSFETTDNSYGWALLEQKATGKRYVQISTHLPAGGKWREAREQSTLLVEDIKKIEAAGYSVITCGDYNSSHNTFEMNIIKAHMKSARDDCATKKNMKIHTVNGGGTGGAPVLGDAIDHVFYSQTGFSANHFETIIGRYGYLSSDHLPILFDFSLT